MGSPPAKWIEPVLFRMKKSSSRSSYTKSKDLSVEKEDGARENVGSLLDLGTAATAHFCRSVLYPAQIIFRRKMSFRSLIQDMRYVHKYIAMELQTPSPVALGMEIKLCLPDFTGFLAFRPTWTSSWMPIGFGHS